MRSFSESPFQTVPITAQKCKWISVLIFVPCYFAEFIYYLEHFCGILRISTYELMSHVNIDNSTSIFHIWMLVIYALIQLIFLYVFADRHVKNYKYYCLEVIKLSILTCFLNLKERCSMFHQWLCCWLWVLHGWHYDVMIISLKFNLSGDFSMKRCLIYSTLLSINWDEHFFPFILLMCVLSRCILIGCRILAFQKEIPVFHGV